MAVPFSATKGVDGNMVAVTGIKVDFSLDLTSPIQKEDMHAAITSCVTQSMG